MNQHLDIARRHLDQARHFAPRGGGWGMREEMATLEELRVQARELAMQAEALRKESNRLSYEANCHEAERDAAALEIGMTVYLRSLPMNWLLRGSGIAGETPMVVEKLGRVNATISRTDGGDFPFPRRNYRRVEVRRTDLRIPQGSR